jgi:protein SCO1
MRRPVVCLLLVLCLSALGCSRSDRQYELRGQVLAVDTDRQELTIRHDDIQGFMPAMTMPFRVREAAVLEGRRPGDLVRATLVVSDTDAYLASVEAIGHVALAERKPPPGAAMPIVAPGDEAPDVLLLDQSGRPLRLSDWRGMVVAVTFIYTRCPIPTFCPLMDRNFAVVQRELGRDPRLAARAQLVSISFDPEFDTPDVLDAHATRVGADPARWRFVTGDREHLDPFSARFGVTTIRDNPDDVEIIHNLRTAVIDPQGRIVAIFSGNDWTPTQLLQAMRAAGA